MLSSIHLLGERARGNRWGATAATYVFGSVSGGMVAGTLAALTGVALSSLVRPSRTTLTVAVVMACLVAAMLDKRVLGLRVPTVRRQVNEDWLNRYRGWVYGSTFGFQLGLGVVTIVTTAAVYLTLAIIVLGGLSAGSLASAVSAGNIAGGVFGMVRAMPVLVFGRTSNRARLWTIHRTMAEMAEPARQVSFAAVCCVAVAACGWRIR
jgi:hypothetical protein